MNFDQFGVGIRSTDAVDGKIEIALEFLKSIKPLFALFGIRGASVVPEVVQALAPAGKFIDRIKVTHHEGDLAAVELQLPLAHIEGQRRFYAAVAICGQVQQFASKFQLALTIGHWLTAAVTEFQAKFRGYAETAELVALLRLRVNLLVTRVRYIQGIAGEEGIRVLAAVFELLVGGVVPYHLFHDAILCADAGTGFSLLDWVFYDGFYTHGLSIQVDPVRPECAERVRS